MPSQLQSLLRRRADACMRREMSRLGAQPFSIIANDCWGGEVYRLAQRPYTTPFIGLMIQAPCYVRILADLDAALGSELIELTSSRYPHVANPPAHPIGLLSAVDAELHFLHYPTFAEAAQKWHRRAARVDRGALFVKTVPSGPEIEARFRELPFDHKLITATRPVPGITTALGHGREDAVLDFRGAAVRFDVVDWLLGGSGQVPAVRLPGRWLAYAGW